MTPVVITVAITGSLPKKSDTPAVPIEPHEQIEASHEAFEAGASIAHIHVRDRDQQPSSDPERFKVVLDGLRKHCPGMVVQFSTGGRGRRHEERGRPLALRPDMASLTTGSVNFANFIYENPPEVVDGLAARMLELGIKPEIEIFDLCMIYNAVEMMERGLLRRPLHVQFVLGIRNALPARERTLDLLIGELAHLMPDATWGALGIGRNQLTVNEWCLTRGGHLRTGLEDNIYRSKGVLAASNAELVELAATLAAKYNRRPATAQETRALLGLPSALEPAGV
jgi:3-keto-5-aminohexanoate cleavage enzyme